MKRILILLLVIAYCSMSANLDAQVSTSGGKQLLLALSKTDHMLAIVDAVTLKVISRIPVGSDPHEVIASSDGKTAYVTIYGGGSLHELNVIDPCCTKTFGQY
jgi:YVTN family beta-propeller protein